MAELSLERLSKSHGDNRVLKDISLKVRDGEFLVLVGPSGCGKSTLLRAIAGLERLDAGVVRIGINNVTDAEPRERDLAMVFQSYALYPHLTVRENLAFALRIQRKPDAEIEQRINETAHSLELSELLDRKPAQLSGGQRQRVAMGRALVRKPKAFLFDEPLSNLDASLRAQMRVELKRLHQRLAATMIYVTHDQVEAMTLADRIVVLRAGEIQQLGTPQEIYDTPQNEFVARFVGSPEMNFLPVAVVGKLTSTPLAPTVTVAGVRAEDIHLESSDDGSNGTVDVVEHLGWEALVHISIDGARLVARVPSERAPRVGTRVRVRLGDKLHLFDEAGRRV